MSGRRYTEEDISRGLAEVALCSGSAANASRRLKAAGYRVPASTLKSWIARHPDRYETIRSEVIPKVLAEIHEECVQVARKAFEVELEALRLLEEKLPQLDAKDLSNAVRNASVTKGVSIDKLAPLRGDPTTIIEHRSRQELYNQLREVGVEVVDGTAEEVDALPELPQAA